MTTLTQSWFAFRAYNSQTLYGYGTAEEADLYVDELNTGRNYYAAYPMTTEQADKLKLNDKNSDLGFNLSIAIADGQT